MKLFENKAMVVTIALNCILLVFIFLAISEYYFFKCQARQLQIVQLHYRTALAMLRKSFDACGGPEEDDDTRSEESHARFVQVNRDPEHLKRAALSYIRRIRPQDVAAVSALYDQKTVLTKNSPSAPRKKMKKRRSARNLWRATWMRSGDTRTIDKKFLWPLERGRFWISSLFGYRRKRDGSVGFHTGIDLAALRGTPICALAQGKVVEAGYDPGYGNTVVLRHADGCKTRYAHMHRIGVTHGQLVAAGQKIGSVGATGNVRATKGDPSHLHLEVSVDGKLVNPLNCLP